MLTVYKNRELGTVRNNNSSANLGDKKGGQQNRQQVFFFQKKVPLKKVTIFLSFELFYLKNSSSFLAKNTNIENSFHLKVSTKNLIFFFDNL